MVDIQSTAAEITRGKKIEEERRKKPQGKNIMSASAMQGGHKKSGAICVLLLPGNWMHALCVMGHYVIGSVVMTHCLVCFQFL